MSTYFYKWFLWWVLAKKWFLFFQSQYKCIKNPSIFLVQFACNQCIVCNTEGRIWPLTNNAIIYSRRQCDLPKLGVAYKPNWPNCMCCDCLILCKVGRMTLVFSFNDLGRPWVACNLAAALCTLPSRGPRNQSSAMIIRIQIAHTVPCLHSLKYF